MALAFAQLRMLVRHADKKKTAKKTLQVKISKEPPIIHKFQHDNLEYSCECIYDPMVCHDTESDHPDLLTDGAKRQPKPWQQPPYCDDPNKMTFRRLAVWTPKPRFQRQYRAASFPSMA